MGGGVIKGVKTGVPGGIVGGINDAVPIPPQQDATSTPTVAFPSTKRVPPVYPSEAFDNHLEGRVNLTLTVNSEGKVSDVEFVGGSPEFVQSAKAAAYQWEFQPPAKAPALVSAIIDFSLSPSRRTSESPRVAGYRDPRSVSTLNMEVIKQDPPPQSAPVPGTNNYALYFDKFVSGKGASPQSATRPIARAGQNGVTMPVCEYCPKPEYSQEARDANIQGTVFLQIVVLTTGRAGEIKVVKGLEESLDKQAIKIIREKWTFKPATDKNGNPVDALVPVEIAFQLLGLPQPGLTRNSAAASPATAPLTPDESLQTKIFTAPVSGNGESTPYYMGLVKTQTVYAPNPELPRFARRANVHQESVTLNIIVNTKGKVIAAQYVKSSNPALIGEAIKTVLDWIIKGTHDGAPVTFQISVEVSFSDK